MKIINKIEDLMGEEISAVSFVRDYVEFHFDGPVLRSVSDPVVIANAIAYRFPEPSSRDALCGVIGSTVRTLKLEEHRALELTTNNNCKIIIPLDDESLQSGEAMHFIPPGGGIQVW